jgi:GTP-binding protein EngB required for normal cell division
MAVLNGPQSRAILCGFLDVHRRMAELEALIATGERPSAFSRYLHDLSPTEAKVAQDYFARIRTAMRAHLEECGILLDVRPASLRWALQTGLSFIGITVEELRPSKLRGYGELGQEARALTQKICEDLGRLVDQVAAYLRQGIGRDLQGRLARLDRAGVGVGTVAQLEEVVARWRLVESRPALEMIVKRLEAPSFEIAVFGRVSSGKSSLLNHLAGLDALPVGVTPVTAVPTRLVSGDRPSAVVSFAESGSRPVGLEHLWGFASEEGNPGNQKHVTSIVVKLPSPRLREGIVFVDTPGIGSLALAGGAETIAYLPRCDLGVVLVDSASMLCQEDLALIRALYGAGIPARLLLSKADLLAPSDRMRLTDYIQEQVRRELGLDLAVHPVSTVGSEESLLTAWFDEELTPLLDRHHSLIEASIKRKIAHLRESVIAALETLLAQRRGARADERAGVDRGAVQQLLDEADETIRVTQEHTSNWYEGRRALAEDAPRLVAEALVSAPGPADEGGCAGVIEAELLRRGRAAHDLIAGLQDALARALERLSGVAPLAHADPSSLRGFHAGGLPVVALDQVLGAASFRRPWWAGLSPPLAVRATKRRIRERFGRAIPDAVELYDRNLESWVKAKLARLVDLYESQAAAFREQLRRLAARTPDADTAGDGVDLESDLRGLRGAEADGEVASRQPVVSRP